MNFLVYLTLIAIEILGAMGGHSDDDDVDTVASDTNYCPQNDGYIYCSSQDGICRIAGIIKEGFMSYGANGRYNLIAFTNSNIDGRDITIKCDNNHGDISPNNVKRCCYKAANIGFAHKNWAGYLQENGGGWKYFSDFETQRYGADGQYVYRTLTKTVGWCSNEFFNNPIFGVNKYCNYNHDEPISLKIAEWTLCANQNVDCDGLISSSYHWIRYGVDGSYYYRLIKSNDYRVPCNDEFFDDPIPGKNKYCWRSTPFSISQLHEFSISHRDEIDMNKYISPQIITSKKGWYLQSYIKNNLSWFFIFSVMVILSTINICFKYKKRRKYKYQFVKPIDSESDIHEEAKPINI